MRIPRRTFKRSRSVSGPDGRTWTVTVVHYRLPKLGEDADEVKDFHDLINSNRLIDLVFGALSLLSARYVFPLLDATIGHRPWIVASAENPPVRMVWRVWRATSRRSVPEVVDEIVAELERGDPVPLPPARFGSATTRRNVLVFCPRARTLGLVTRALKQFQRDASPTP
jgi:hypothetical protein